ncbi:hypothetical protein ACFVHB_39240 [Kitasatospora sp. NPDC127111]|uniref:NADH-quinone oxidoreductase subunit D-related protein n=1 Tax=Kitasatospora sp. NPDC127111 TaxID=3345363 RepID=UPI003637C38F
MSGDTAVLTHDAARGLGCLGPVARASSLPTDARHAHPDHDHGEALTTHVLPGGDVLARFRIRAQEAQTSPALAERLADRLPLGATADRPPPYGNHRPSSGSGLAEGWRGTIATRIELAATSPPSPPTRAGSTWPPSSTSVRRPDEEAMEKLRRAWERHGFSLLAEGVYACRMEP